MLRISELAKAQKLNITNLANKAGMAYSQVYGLWSGKTERPALTSLQKIADALHVPVGALFDDGTNETGILVTIRIPDELHARIVKAAEQDERSINREIIALLRKALEDRKKA